MKTYLTLSNGEIQVRFDAHGAIAALVNLTTGTDYVSEPVADLWSMLLVNPPHYVTIRSHQLSCEIDPSGAGRSGETGTLTWVVREFGPGLGPEPPIGTLDEGDRSAEREIIVRCTARVSGDELTLSASIENRSGLEVRSFTFPVLAGTSALRDKGDRWLYWPTGPGQRFPDPEERPRQWNRRYPMASMQWLEYANRDEGLYFGSHDERLDTMFMDAVTSGRSLFLSYTKYPFLESGGSWSSGDFVVSPHTGDWHAGARTYRAWAATWRARPGRPAWTETWNGWLLVILKQQNGAVMWRYEDLPQLLDIARRSGLDTLGVFGWAIGGHDHLYPDYSVDPLLGTREDLERAIKEVHRKGGRVVLYTTGESMDSNSPEYEKTGRRLVARQEDGNSWASLWRKALDHPGYITQIMCPGTDEWKERLREFARYTHGYGADAIIYDLLGGGGNADFCFATDHGHGNPAQAIGPEVVKAFQAIQDEMHTVDPEFALVTERANDAISVQVDLVHSCGDGAHYAPESFPPLYRYTFPDTRMTNRFQGAPYLRPAESNFIFTYGLSVDLECRYPPDAVLLRTGRRPTDADYAMTPTPPDVNMMCREPVEAYEAYLAELCAIRAEHPVLLSGEFIDTDGFTIDNPDLTAVAYRSERELAVVVWNEGSAEQRFRITVTAESHAGAEPGYAPAEELRPGAANRAAGEPLPGGHVAVLLFRRKEG